MLEAMPTQAEYDAMSDSDLLRRANRFGGDGGETPAGAELLGEFSIEEAVQMGAFFDDPAEQAAFDEAVEARGLRYP